MRKPTLRRPHEYPRSERTWMAAAFLAAAVAGAVTVPAGAAPAGGPRPGRQPRLSIATPATGNLVAGLVQVAVAFDAGSAVRITALELWVDDLLFNSQALDTADARGTQTIDWDTLRLHNGQHSLKVRAFSGRKLVATDSAIVTVSNGGVDVVPPLVSFYAPLDGQIVSGNVNIGINAADNDQVALVGLFVNRQLKMMKSNAPFQYTLDTTTLPLMNGRGALVLEAWAYDRAQNRGMAKPITVYVQNAVNATPMQGDPKKGASARGTGGMNPPAGSPAAPAPSGPELSKVVRLSPLDALLSPPAAVKTPKDTPATPVSQVKMPTPATPPPPQIAPSTSADHLIPAPTRRVEMTLGSQPTAKKPGAAPPSSRPSRTETTVRPKATAPHLDISLKSGAAADAKPQLHPGDAASPRAIAPSRTPRPHAQQSLAPAPVSLKPVQLARVPEGALVAVPRSLDPALAKPPAHSSPKAAEPHTPPPAPQPVAIEPARALPKPVAAEPGQGKSAAGTKSNVAKPAAQGHTQVAARHSETPRHSTPQRGSTPDRIVLPVYRLARLPEKADPSQHYTVQRGDTLTRIAQRHGVTGRSILVANGLEGPNDLRAGQHLTIPGTFTIAYNDQPVGFDVQPRVESGMAITPFRQIFEHTGGVVQYHPVDREVQAASPDKQVRIKIGSREALVNSAVVLMDRAAFLDSGRTMVPVKFMTEALDLKAEYDVKTGAIYLIHK